MWRNFINAFEKTLVFVPKRSWPASAGWKAHRQLTHQSNPFRFFNASCIVQNEVERIAPVAGTAEADGEYIVPYKTEFEKSHSLQVLTDALHARFRLSEEDLVAILNDALVIKNMRKKSLILSMDHLISEGVEKHNFIEYPWIMTLYKGSLIEKIEILKSLRGFQNINDYIPFLRIKYPRLRKLVGCLNKEADFIEYGNRVHFISNKLQVPISTVTKYMAKRLFVLEMPLDMFRSNLETMLKYNVESKNILKDLWAFRYAPRSVEARLKRAMSAKKDKIMPWMVRCPEYILQKSLQITLDDQKILGDRTIAEYIGERLGFPPEEAQAIMNRHPQVNNVRVTKIKEVLDYLLDEAKFSRYEVAQVPRILCHSLETTKQRMQELKEHGCRPSTLVIICRSKREYNKFLNSWIENYNPNKNVNAAVDYAQAKEER
ncbi:transcription termination factor, mitochondrial [Stomoxys calcitrans]|uniref:transcription termination factor, mitochondrial n=1 Tax=Stomoxys calcitrans TaxID=35570 RepID=UPI0027E32CB1|nr:transcription termination factor, mitochondrial [Stomoxys calcitrans]